MVLRLATHTAPTANSPSPCRFISMRIAAMAFALTLFFQGWAAARTFDEYQLKAVFLYRLSLFITWPEQTFTAPEQPFIIGILGNDPFGDHIDRVIKNEKVGGHPIRVRRYALEKDVLADPCQILFISHKLSPNWPRLKRLLNNHPMLTVSDMDQFGQMGGMVHIRTQNRRIKIEINTDETRKSGLVVSSKLLKVARLVRSDILREHQ